MIEREFLGMYCDGADGDGNDPVGKPCAFAEEAEFLEYGFIRGEEEPLRKVAAESGWTREGRDDRCPRCSTSADQVAAQDAKVKASIQRAMDGFPLKREDDDA